MGIEARVKLLITHTDRVGEFNVAGSGTHTYTCYQTQN